MAQTAPKGFGSTAFRFDVRGAHPKSKPPGTVIAQTYYASDKQRRLGPGTHDFPMDLTSDDARRRTTSCQLDEWTTVSSNPKRDHLVSIHRKTLREFKSFDASQRGPGFYDVASFTEHCDRSRSLHVNSARRDTLSPMATSTKLPAASLPSSAAPHLAKYDLGRSAGLQPRSASPDRHTAGSPPYGFGRLSSRDDQRELHKTTTFAGDMFMATNNVTTPGMYELAPAKSPHSKTYHSAFLSATPRFDKPAMTVDYENERLRARNTSPMK